MKQSLGSRRNWLSAVVVAALLAGVPATPGFAQSKKPSGNNQSEAARKALEKQRDIAQGLRDKQANDPNALAKQIADLKAQVDAEKSRSGTAVAALEKELAGFQTAGDKRRVDRTQSAIDREKAASAARIADLEKRIADLQARADAAGAGGASAPAPPR